MSYDIDMVLDAGGEDLAYLTNGITPTYNVGGIFRFVIPPDGLCVIKNKTGEAALPTLLSAWERVNDPGNFASMRELEPDNGWGNTDTVRESLKTMIEWAEKYPKATFQIYGCGEESPLPA